MQTKSLQTKRALRAALLVLLLGVAAMGKGYAYSFSAVCPSGQTLYYNIYGGVYVELTYPSEYSWNPYNNFTKPTGDIVLPEIVTYNGRNYTVAKIGERAFYHCDGLTGNLAIPNTVISIGDNAFFYCSGFTGGLVIPNSVTTIGSAAFSYCRGLTGDLVIPNSVTTIGDNAFSGCSGFTGGLVISNSVTRIGNSTFSGCSGFTGELVIPNSVTVIGERAFFNCLGFTGGLTIPNSVTTIGDSAFEKCYDFRGSLTLPNSITRIGSDVFSDCSFYELIIDFPSIPSRIANQIGGNYDALTIGGSVVSIGERAFENCSSFTGSLTIPNSVTSIGECAFGNCSGFTGSLIIPNTVRFIGDYAFSGCSGFTGGLTIPGSLTVIRKYAFNGCSGFTGSLTIPGTVKTIGDYAFGGCSGFTGSLTIPNSVTYIGEYAFYGCSGFTGSLTIPNSVTTINTGAFNHCSGFTGSLTIPNTVTSIGNVAFTGCSGFTGNLVIPSSVTSIGVDIPGVWYPSGVFEGCSGITGVTIPYRVGEIRYATFKGCSSLTSVNLANVHSIGREAFYGCSSLTSVTIPNTVTSIDKSAFSNTGWYNLQPDGILYLSNWCMGYKGTKPTGFLALYGDTRGIADEAFIDCCDLTSISIPVTMAFIGNKAFKNCIGINEINFNAKNCGSYTWADCSEAVTLVIGDSVESVVSFSGLENLTTVTIGKSVKSIGYNAFANNPRLNMVYYNVEKDLEAATNVFYNCPNLTTIHIGPEVQEIGSNIFKGCNTVHFVVALGPTPAVLDAGAFSDIVDNSVLMVSCGKRVTYYSVWNMFPFNNIIEDCDTYGINVGAVGSGGTITPSVTEAQMGQEVQITITPNPGMVLVSIKVVNANDPTQVIPISPSGKAASTYSFTMPPFEVVVMATFKNSGTSVGENNSVELAVYPNPTNGLVKIEAESIKHVSISNILGQIVFDGKVGGDAFEYDFSGQKAGIYLVRIETASGVAVKKVSVTR